MWVVWFATLSDRNIVINGDDESKTLRGGVNVVRLANGPSGGGWTQFVSGEALAAGSLSRVFPMFLLFPPQPAAHTSK